MTFDDEWCPAKRPHTRPTPVKLHRRVETAKQFEQPVGENAALFTLDPAKDLWPLEAQAEEDVAQEEEGKEDEEETDPNEMIGLVGFNAAEDALEIPYFQKQDTAGNAIPAEISAGHHNGWTEVGVDGDVHSFVHTADDDFKGPEPEDMHLRVA